MSVANPSDFIPQLITWSTLSIFATWSLVVLLAVTLFLQGPTANSTLINLEFIFIIASSTNSILIWTGHALNPEPPFTLCVFNASAIMANLPLMAGAAVTIVIKVWGTAMMFWHPRCRSTMVWIIWPPFLVLFPFLLAVPIFIAGVVIGLKNRTAVFRGSPFYCVVNLGPIQTTSSLLGAVFTFTSLVLASWTAIKLLGNRRRAGSRLTDDAHLSYAFGLRVLLFSVFTAAAFVSSIVGLTSTFDAVIPDIIVASCGVGAFFIFASSRPILRFVFLCQREPSSRSYTPSATRISWRSRNTPQEFTLPSNRSPTGSKPLETYSSGFAADSQITHTVETPDIKYPWETSSLEPMPGGTKGTH